MSSAKDDSEDAHRLAPSAKADLHIRASRVLLRDALNQGASARDVVELLHHVAGTLLAIMTTPGHLREATDHLREGALDTAERLIKDNVVQIAGRAIMADGEASAVGDAAIKAAFDARQGKPH